MLIFQSIIVGITLATGTVQALVAQPRSGEISTTDLKQRQTNRNEIVKRAIEKGSLAKRQGPSALPV